MLTNWRFSDYTPKESPPLPEVATPSAFNTVFFPFPMVKPYTVFVWLEWRWKIQTGRLDGDGPVYS